MSTKRTKSRSQAGAPKPVAPSSDSRIVALEEQVATLSKQIENVAKFLALGIVSQAQSSLLTAGASPDMQAQLLAALQADAAQADAAQS